jgi:enoyl-CoA hydratase
MGKTGCMTDEVLLFEVSERIATITLNRPQSRNALSVELLGALSLTIGECDSRDDIDVAILTGSDPAFCAGLDLKELAAGDLRLGQRDGRPPGGERADEMSRGPFGFRRTPLIGAINGPAVTGGLEVALACDFLVASERASFADTHARVGIQPSWGLTVLLPQAIGLRRAREMSSTSNYVDAATALQWGLVNHVVPHEELIGFARRLASEVAASDRPSLRRLLASYQEGSLTTADQAWAIESAAAREWLRSGHGRADDIGARRSAITSRGSTQVH